MKVHQKGKQETKKRKKRKKKKERTFIEKTK